MADDEDEKEDGEDAESTENAEGEDGEGGEGGEGGKKKSKKKLFIIIGAVVVLLIGGGAGAFFTGLLDPILGIEAECVEGEPAQHAEQSDEEHKSDEDSEAKEGEDSEAQAMPKPCPPKETAGEGGEVDKEAMGVGHFLKVPELIVNLNSTERQPRFLKISVELELEHEEEVPKLEAVMPRIKDQFQTYLRELRVEDLKGSSGLYRLRLELLSRVNAVAPGLKVKNILFQEILIQ